VDVQHGSFAPAAAPARDKFGVSQRRRYRYEIHSLSYINIDEDNGGVIRNLNESGLCVQSVSPLRKDQQVRLRFELLGPRARVGATAQVRWVSASGLAGLEFAELNPRSGQLIKDWLLTQLLLRGQRLFVSNSIFAEPSRLDASLAVTGARGAVRPSITASQSLLSEVEASDPQDARAKFWALLVDSAAILTGVLLFSVIAIGMMKSLPDWLVCSAVTVTTAAILTGLYWALFASWIGATPGNYLAEKVFGKKGGLKVEERSRFR
jgi:hypothetical protein